MMLTKFTIFDFWNEEPRLPAVREAAINPTHIMAITPMEGGAREDAPADLLRVRLRDGSILVVVGPLDDFLRKANGA